MPEPVGERGTVVHVVVWAFPHEGQDVRSVWSTLDAAEAEADRLNTFPRGPNDHFVMSVELDVQEAAQGLGPYA